MDKREALELRDTSDYRVLSQMEGMGTKIQFLMDVTTERSLITPPKKQRLNPTQPKPLQTFPFIFEVLNLREIVKYLKTIEIN